MLTLKIACFIITFLAFCQIVICDSTQYKNKMDCIKEIKTNFGILSKRPKLRTYANNAIKLMRDSPDKNLNTITSENARRYFHNVVFQHLMYGGIPAPSSYCCSPYETDCLGEIHHNFGKTDDVFIIVEDMYKNHVHDKIPTTQQFAKDYMGIVAKQIKVPDYMPTPADFCERIHYGKKGSTSHSSSNSYVDVTLKL